MRLQRQPQLRGFFSLDSLLDPAGISAMTDDACATAANADLSSSDADIVDVTNNWQTTGFYTPDQLGSICDFAAQVAGRAIDALGAAIMQMQFERHRAMLNAAQDDLQGPSNDLTKFVNAVAEARREGANVIEAQGFKRFIIDMLKAARGAKFATEVVACARPDFLFSVLQALESAKNALINAVLAVVAVVKKVGDLVLKVPDLLSSFFSFLKVFPWVVLAFGSYYVAVKADVIPPKFDPLKLRDRETFKPWRKKA